MDLKKLGIVLCVLVLMAIEAMGSENKNNFKKNRPKSRSRPIDTAFKLPITTNAWPEGNGFAGGVLDLGGLQVAQVSIFRKVWGAYDGGQDDQGAAVYDPIGIPEGFSMLGSYIQPNNKPLFGYVLVAKDVSNKTLQPPSYYTLISSTESDNQDFPLYIWLPMAPDGYHAVGLVVTTTPNSPPLDKVACVRADFTDQCETTSWIWGSDDLNFYDVRPSNRGIQAPGIRVGTFVAQKGGDYINPPPFSCLKNLNPISTIMPNLKQIDALLQVYSPYLYLHSEEDFLPSSVNWFFSNGALLYKKGDESNPVPIQQDGANLPQDQTSDDAYWIDLPADEENKDRVQGGNLESAESYVHVKPMFGGTFTDIVMWIFYPFNGGGRAKIEFINIDLGRIGEHVGDWEHVTLRISNFDGQLYHVYFSQHSSGSWIDSSLLEFLTDDGSFDFPTKRPIVYASLHGHANYPHAGLVLIGKNGVGARDDTDRGILMDLGKYVLVSAEHLGGEVKEPGWVNFLRAWGPKIDYNLDDELRKVKKFLPGKLKDLFEKLITSLPKEVLGQEGPTGPKEKSSWNGDEL